MGEGWGGMRGSAVFILAFMAWSNEVKSGVCRCMKVPGLRCAVSMLSLLSGIGIVMFDRKESSFPSVLVGNPVALKYLKVAGSRLKTCRDDGCWARG